MRLWLGIPVVPPEHWSTSAVVFDGFNYGGELPIIPGLLVAAPATRPPTSVSTFAHIAVLITGLLTNTTTINIVLLLVVFGIICTVIFKLANLQATIDAQTAAAVAREEEFQRAFGVIQQVRSFLPVLFCAFVDVDFSPSSLGSRSNRGRLKHSALTALGRR